MDWNEDGSDGDEYIREPLLHRRQERLTLQESPTYRTRAEALREGCAWARDVLGRRGEGGA